MANNEEVKITESKIDKDVLDIMKNGNVLDTIEDPKLENRFILRYFCEYLSEQKKENALLSELARIVTMMSKDKLAEFYNGVKVGFAEEKKRADVQEIIAKGHKKPKKSVKK